MWIGEGKGNQLTLTPRTPGNPILPEGPRGPCNQRRNYIYGLLLEHQLYLIMPPVFIGKPFLNPLKQDINTWVINFFFQLTDMANIFSKNDRAFYVQLFYILWSCTLISFLLIIVACTGSPFGPLSPASPGKPWNRSQ